MPLLCTCVRKPDKGLGPKLRKHSTKQDFICVGSEQKSKPRIPGLAPTTSVQHGTMFPSPALCLHEKLIFLSQHKAESYALGTGEWSICISAFITSSHNPGLGHVLESVQASGAMTGGTGFSNNLYS